MIKLKAIICIIVITFIFISCSYNEKVNCLVSTETSNQETDAGVLTILYPSYDKNTKKGGYIDDNKNWIIPPVYDEVGVSYVENSNQNMFPVKINDKWGYVDRKNQWIIEPRFIVAFYFTEDGVALTSEEEIVKRFIKDENGNEKEIGLEEDITKYIPQSDFEEGFASKYSIYYTYINFGYINELGEWIIEPRFRIPIEILEVVPAWQFEFDKGVALMYDIHTGKYGFISEKGDWKVNPQYDLEEAIEKRNTFYAVK